MSDVSPSSYNPAPQPAYYPQEGKPERRGPGCFLWGCIIAVVLFVGGLAAVFGGGYYMYAQMRDKFTDTQPMTLPEIPLSQEQRQSVQERFDRFREAVDSGQATEPLELNEDEINTLIAESDSDDPMKDSVRVQIEDDTLKGQISVPLDDLPLPGLKGRYFNGTADLRGSLKDGKLEVFIENASVKGEPLPDNVMTELRRENLTAEIMNDPEARETLEKLESMEVRDGKVIIVPKVLGETDGSIEEQSDEDVSGATRSPVPPYDVVDSETIPGVKRSLDIRLAQKISREDLRSLALKLKAADSGSYERTFIAYYLPDMTIGAGAWATTHFDPDLEVKILGLSLEDERKLQSSPAPQGDLVVGRWQDERPFVGARISIVEEEDRFFIHHEFNDGSDMKTELVEKASQEGRRFEELEGSRAGAYWIIDGKGLLQIRDDDGLIATARKL